ncbi:MAG: DUF465 domain-containing protein [Sphingomonadales bacterium CG12_big_fil_rev_8_21_14_0_65_65_10]|jgi:hypothetical protein|uniref:YdcH family protein n=1 Tax=Blastomonas marina TaxID=1867408 RepID=UPI000CC54F6F|nr:YdcH family protein [Blastomonas marina]PIW55202.1 MAG: DUF465 domain-containing protein [Sphingomonadales bacterium CG12_big_fil_rev_8_21_14_0_65_65_10]WPZ04561.1 YdcH family protein [Blastomonas marina]
MTARTFKLTEMHQRIDARLRAAQRRPAPDWAELSRLKRAKLRIKDMLARLAAGPRRS